MTAATIVDWPKVLRTGLLEDQLHVIDHVWTHRDSFLRWPEEPLLFCPGATRDQKYHRDTNEQEQQIRAAGVKPDGRSNDPAIMSYHIAGGERPTRQTGKGWSIHHIYDGQFPAPGRDSSVRAVKNGDLFTEAAGLVAIHPLADALADEFAYFAWLLRRGVSRS